jgi:5-methylcytosine-specific restriction enzyme B
MLIRERQRLYKETVGRLPEVTQHTRLADAFGVSNSAKVIEKALFAFNANLDRLSDDVDQLVIHCLLRFPPEDEIYFSLFIKTGLASLRQRLAEMRATGTTRPRGAGLEEEEDEVQDASASPTALDGLSYTNNNKNVKGYLARDGRLYLRNKSYWDTMPTDLGIISHPVSIDKIVFAIWPPAASARRSLLAREFVGYLGGLVGRDKVHELTVWVDAAGVRPEMRRMPQTIPVATIEAAVKAAGGHYPGGEVRRYHAALNFLANKHFVILSGLSGTGKTQLALQYARAVHGITDRAAEDPFLFVCAVRPEWTDPTGLTGYFDVLSNRYVVPPFLEAILLATAYRDSPVFVVLDELNLARVEYYLSDVLSAVETGEALQLHSNSVPIEGTTGTSIRAKLPLPPNLYITGTVNIDETTTAVSDKVLDRALLIDMSAIDLAGFLSELEVREPSLKEARTACEGHLLAANNLMAPHGLGFGYRVAEEVVRYHAFAAKYLAEASDAATDDLMVQKVLVKLRGGEKQRPLLGGLARALTGLRRSQELIVRLTSDLDEFGSFQASR